MFDTKGEAGVDRPPVMAAFGGGLDSTAMLAVLCSRGLVPDAVLFADTGAEKPETYLHIFLMDDWLHARGIRCPGDSVWRRPPGYEDTGLPVPGKSSCFYCSAMKKPEIVSLIQLHPRLMDRALEMEANAELKTVKGLGRYFSWAEYTKEIEKDGPPAPKEKPEKWALAPGQHVTCTCEGQVLEGDYIDSDDYVEEEGSLPTE